MFVQKSVIEDLGLFVQSERDIVATSLLPVSAVEISFKHSICSVWLPQCFSKFGNCSLWAVTGAPQSFRKDLPRLHGMVRRRTFPAK